MTASPLYWPHVDQHINSTTFWTNGRRRHAALIEALLNRRKTQVANRTSMMQEYTKLLDGFAKLRAQQKVVEIISDGLNQGEPLWHGLVATAKELRIFTETEQRDYSLEVRDRREDLQTELKHPTHFAMGELFAEPILLCVGQDAQGAVQCSALRGNGWMPLLDCGDLPLRRQPREATTISELNSELAFLHEGVLWPALVGTKQRTQKYFSVVLLQSCAWNVMGVWAMHGLASHFSPQDANRAFDFRQATRVVFPPAFCINDVSGATLARDRAHYHRLLDTEVFRRATGRDLLDDSLSTNVQRFEDHDRSVYYDSEPYEERSQRYGRIFGRACCFLAGRDEIPKSDLADVNARLFQTMDLLFICYHRSAAIPGYLASVIERSARNEFGQEVYLRHRRTPILSELQELAISRVVDLATTFFPEKTPRELATPALVTFYSSVRKAMKRIKRGSRSEFRDKQRAAAGLLWCAVAARMAQRTSTMRRASPWLLNGLLTLFYSITHDRRRQLTSAHAPRALAEGWSSLLSLYGVEEPQYRNLVALVHLSKR